MSWEEDFRTRYPCPCGEGEYEEIHMSDDWNRSQVRHIMLCPSCQAEYVYDNSIIYGHPGKEIERGWVKKSVLEKERDYIISIESKARDLYLQDWLAIFLNTRNKKEIWMKLTKNGTYYPSLTSFYRYTRGFDKDQLMDYLSSYFKYNELPRIFDILYIKPDAEKLGLNSYDQERYIHSYNYL